MFGLKKIKHPTHPTLYHYHLKRLPNAGAASLVFEPKWTLPIVLARGAGTVTGMLRVTQPPQQYVNPTTITSGLGGIQAGQMAMQPLIDNGGN